MKIIQPNVELIPFISPGKTIELAGRLCYKSEDKITNDSYIKFIQALASRKHFGCLEHENLTVQLKNNFLERYLLDREHFFVFNYKGNDYVNANMRAWYELIQDINNRNYVNYNPFVFNQTNYNRKMIDIGIKKINDNSLARYYPFLFEILVPQGELVQPTRIRGIADVEDDVPGGVLVHEWNPEQTGPTGIQGPQGALPPVVDIDDIDDVVSSVENDYEEYDPPLNRFDPYIFLLYKKSIYEKIKYFTFQITTTRSISHQIVRHRKLSFNQESQRYCSYNKDKFDKSVKYIVSPRIKDDQNMLKFLLQSEEAYFNLLDSGLSPELAREVLPNATATTLIATGTLEMWKHFLDLRTDSHAQEEIQFLAKKIKSFIDEEVKNDILKSYVYNDVFEVKDAKLKRR